MILDKKCKTKWRAVSGEVLFHFDHEFHRAPISDVGAYIPVGNMVTDAARKHGVNIDHAVAYWGGGPDKLYARLTGAHLSIRNDTDLDKVFARIKDEYGVEIEFVENPSDGFAETHDRELRECAAMVLQPPQDGPPWSFRSTVPKEEKPSTEFCDLVEAVHVEPATGEQLDRLAGIPVGHPETDDELRNRIIEDGRYRQVMTRYDIEGVCVARGERLDQLASLVGLYRHGTNPGVDPTAWPGKLRKALESIDGVTVVKMDVDFEAEKMHLVLDHPERRRRPNDRHPPVTVEIETVIGALAPSWADRCYGGAYHGQTGWVRGNLGPIWDWASDEDAAPEPQPCTKTAMREELEQIEGVKAAYVEDGEEPLAVHVSIATEARGEWPAGEAWKSSFLRDKIAKTILKHKPFGTRLDGDVCGLATDFSSGICHEVRWDWV